MTKLRPLIDPGAAASIVIHATLLVAVLVFSGIRPFQTESAKAISVDLVTPDEIKPPEKEPAPPQPDLKLPDLALKDSLDKPSEPQQKASPKPQATEQPAPTPPPAQMQPPAQNQPLAQKQSAPMQQAAAPSQPPPPPAAPPPAAPAPTPPAYQPPQPDVTVKYGVMLGLPAPADKGDFDTTAFQAAKVSSVDIEAFRRHLKACSPMPDTVSVSDDVWIKLRASFTPDGRLAAPPILIEGKASPKALALANGAIAALQACQPYAMLPADKYNEWKILDLEFSPKDFTGG